MECLFGIRVQRTIIQGTHKGCPYGIRIIYVLVIVDDREE